MDVSDGGWKPRLRAVTTSWLRAGRPHGDGAVTPALEVLIAKAAGSLAAADGETRELWTSRLESSLSPRRPVEEAPPQAGAASDTRPSGAGPFTTWLSLLALDALGERASSPEVPFGPSFDRAAITDWLGRLDWSQPLAASAALSTVLFLLVHRMEAHDDPVAAALHVALDWLDENQHREAGVWGSQPYASLPDAITAAGLLLPFYDYVRRPILRRSRLLEVILDFRSERDPLVLERDPLAELAIVECLLSLSRHSSSEDAGSRALLLAAHRELRLRLETVEIADGAPRTEATSPVAADPPAPEALWALWHRSTGLAAIERRYPDVFGSSQSWSFHRWPIPGFYPASRTLDDADRHRLARWLRVTSAAPSSSAETVDPVVSVVVPCFNLGEYLPEALESVSRQTLPDIEVVVVDDGSTDELTLLVLDSLAWPRTRVIRQPNRGVAAARNRGIDETRGRYVCCLDPDDTLAPRYLEQAAAILNGDRGVGLVSGHYELFDEIDSVLRPSRPQFPEALIENVFIEPGVFRRKVWEELGGYYGGFSVTGIEDWDLWIRLLEAGYRAVILPEVVMRYRIRQGQMSDAMYQEDRWARVTAELVERHQGVYRRYLPDVFAGGHARWVRIRRWADEQERALRWWSRHAAQLERIVAQGGAELERRADHSRALGEALAWWRAQAESWERATLESRGVEASLRSHLRQLEEGAAWWREQARSWEEQMRFWEAQANWWRATAEGLQAGRPESPSESSS